MLNKIILVLLSLFPLAASAANIVFIASSPVTPGKFVGLSKSAQKHGVSIEAFFAEKTEPEVLEKALGRSDYVFFDTPRDHIEDFVRTKHQKAVAYLKQSKKPVIWMRTKNPSGENIDKKTVEALHGYYVNGGAKNFDNFFRFLAAVHKKEPTNAIATPIIFPPSAVYYPKYEGLIFSGAKEFFEFKKESIGAKPVIGIAIHQQYVSAEQTAFVDDLIARIESGGAMAMAFYTPVMEPNAITDMVKVDGRVIVDVLINTQIMLNPEGRKKEFEALEIPVIQAMAYKKGDTAIWETDKEGISLMDVPFYLSQAEYAGVTDIQVAAATRKSDEQTVSIPYQADAVVAKAINLIKLQRLNNKEKSLSFFFYNYPPGEKNLSASFLNVPKSLVETLDKMGSAGYDVKPIEEEAMVVSLQRLLAPFYRKGELDGLLRDGLAELLPIEKYYNWLATLPKSVREELTKNQKKPEDDEMCIQKEGRRYFVIPRLKLGKINILPQPSRSPLYGQDAKAKEKALYHNTKEPPSHFYMAVYLWARTQAASNAIIHYGTHGSEEWLPGKERGLSVYDYPMLAVGDIPVVYPYIVDNIGEALQTKRRGRATVITHQTPPFAPAGLHERLTAIHDELHAWLAQDDGAVKDKIKDGLVQKVVNEKIDKDMGVSVADIKKDFGRFVDDLHAYLHELAQTAQPLGLHTFGKSDEERYRIGNILMMTDKGFWETFMPKGEADELFVGDYKKLSSSLQYGFVKKYIIDKEAYIGGDENISKKISELEKIYDMLDAKSENEALLSALNGKYIQTSYGGDPIKNPSALPTGRNLYGFDPSKVPTKAAFEAGKEAMENLLKEHKKQKGEYPKKLTFSLWSVETMRHQGILEAEAMYAMGVEPVYDGGGRVVDVKLIDRATLGRPRVDVVLSATGLYRDHFPNTMKNLAKAVKIASEANETDNAVAINSQKIAKLLKQKGLTDKEADNAAKTRIFSSESGRYGTGLDDAALATDTWKEKKDGDAKLAELYLSRMQYGYGPDEKNWGEAGKKGVNLYSEHLKGTEGAVLSRTSNLYGMLTTDDPFQYLGGISVAVKHLDGKAPQLYISNLRGSGSGKIEEAGKFLAKELATRNFHPGYIEGLMKEGYSGTLQVLDGINNFWGWQATAAEIVRDDQWQGFMDVYVKDKHNLGLKKWFEKNNPHALAQSVERMLEAARKGYWKADQASIDELKNTYKELAKKYDVKTDNKEFEKYVAIGYGLNSASKPVDSSALKASQEPSGGKPKEQVKAKQSANVIKGIKLEKAEEKKDDVTQADFVNYGILALFLSFTAGGISSYRRSY